MNSSYRRPESLGRALAAVLVLVVSAAALGDVVTLKDGSRIVGTVERLEGGQLSIATEFAGTIVVDYSLVSSVETAQPMNVQAASGSKLVGTVKATPGSEKAVVETEEGDVGVNVENIEGIWPQGEPSPQERVLQAQIDAARGKWTATFEAGLVSQEGNTKRFNARGRAQIQHQTDKDLLRFSLSGEYAEENRKRSAAEVKAGAYFEHLFTERFFGYAKLDLEYDEFERLDLRLSAVGGGGYYWLKKADHEFKTRAGLGYLHELYQSGRTVDSAQAELGFDYRVDIAPWLQFINSSTWYPTFDGLDDYRLVSDSAFLIPLGDSDIWKLKLGAEYEYKSLPNPGRERLDQTYYANILVELK